MIFVISGVRDDVQKEMDEVRLYVRKIGPTARERRRRKVNLSQEM